MSRSRKKVPIHWDCSLRMGEMQKWKTRRSRRFRRNKLNIDVCCGNLYKKISGDLWLSPADGKSYWDGKSCPEECEQMMRK